VLASKAVRDPFTQAIINLRSHLINCYKCRAVFADPDLPNVCQEGIAMCMQVAHSCNALLATKRQAVSTINHYVYACPDIAVHGEAYAMTAQPMAVVGVQDGLF
jgi:hypothetical protein